MKNYIYAIALVIFSSGCKSFSIIERSNEYIQAKNQPSKIVVLPIDFITSSNADGKKMYSETKGLKIMRSTIEKALNKIKIEGIFIENETDNTADFFEYILPLKQELITSSELHDDIFKQTSKKTFTVKLFGNIPKTAPNYVPLFDKYGTRYVLYTGIFTNHNQHFQYIILADIVRSEIVYRNLIYMHSTAKRSHIEPVLYDAFLSLKNKP